MLLPSFHLHQPSTLTEALALAARHAGAFDWLSGGTDLLPNYKCGLNPSRHVIALGGIAELGALTETGIGAGVRLSTLERSDHVQRAWPVLHQAVREVASPLLRNSGTVGGNLMLDTRCMYFNQGWFWRDSQNYCLKAEGTDCLVVPGKSRCFATYSGDLAPALLVLGARLQLASPGGVRRVDLADFYVDEGMERFRVLPQELVVGVEVPEDAAALRGGYLKLRIRDAIDFPSLGVAVALRRDGDGTLTALRVATTAVSSCPVRHDSLTAPFVGTRPGPREIGSLAAAVSDASRCYLNVPLPPRYRQKMVGVFVQRLLARLLETPAADAA